MSNIQSYNALIDRFKAFAAGHFILKRFSHGQIEVSDLEKFGEYPFLHVIPSNVTYSQGMKTFSFQIVLADLPRDKEDKSEYQREALSDLQRIAEDLIAEITNHRVLFGDLITVQNVSLEPFLEEFQHTLTGWTVSLDLLVPYYWDACSIPAEWNDFFESSTGGTGSILTFIDSITRDENGNVSLVNDEAEPSPNYYYGTNDEGVRGWYLLTDEVGLTCVTLPTCQTIIDIEAAIDDLQEEILLKANTADLGAVAFSNDYNDLDNKPTIPDVSGFVPYTGATTDVDLGTHNLTADHIALNVSPSGAGYVVGATEWNNTLGSSQTLLKGGSVSLKNGVDLVARIVNKVTPNTTLTKAAYQAVRISGAQGGRLAVALAQANNDTNSADTIGIVTETIATNQEGFILTVGQLENINTTGSLQGETWADGDVLYLSPTTAGALTNIKPTGATGHIVVVGYVEYAHANNGSIYVKVMNGWELDELHNVYISSPANNEVLTYESSTSLWKNKTVATALGYTPVPETRTLTINGTTQDLSANRTFTISASASLAVGTTPITSGTVGRVLFEGTGNVLQESANITWNNTTGAFNVIGLVNAKSTATQTSSLIVEGTTGVNSGNAGFALKTGTGYQPIFFAADSLAGQGVAGFGIYSGISIPFGIQTGAGNGSLFIHSNGNIGIGTNYINAGYKLDVNGISRVNGSLVLGTYGSGTGVFWDNSTNNLGIGNTSPGQKLDILGTNIVATKIKSTTNTGASSYQAFNDVNNSYEFGMWGSTRGGYGAINSGNAYLYGSIDLAITSLSNIKFGVGSTPNERMRIVGSTGNVLIGTTTDVASSKLTIESTTQGFLPPRMTTTQKNAIASPASGLVVYDTTLGKLCVRGASAWETITSV